MKVELVLSPGTEEYYKKEKNENERKSVDLKMKRINKEASELPVVYN